MALTIPLCRLMEMILFLFRVQRGILIVERPAAGMTEISLRSIGLKVLETIESVLIRTVVL